MKLTKKNIGDLVLIKWRDHSSCAKWRKKSNILKDETLYEATIGIYHGNSEYENVVYSTYELGSETVGQVFWILRTDIVYVKVILKKKEVAKL